MKILRNGRAIDFELIFLKKKSVHVFFSSLNETSDVDWCSLFVVEWNFYCFICFRNMIDDSSPIYQYSGHQLTNAQVADCVKFTVTSPFNVQTENFPFEPQHNLNLFFCLLSLSMLSVRIAFSFFMCLFHWMERNLKCTRMHCMLNYAIYAIRYTHTLALILFISFHFCACLRTFS